MLVRPRVFAVPHVSGPLMAPGMAQACDPWGEPGQCGYCPNDFSCKPYGPTGGCIDATHCGGGYSIVGVAGIIIIAAPAPGPT